MRKKISRADKKINQKNKFIRDMSGSGVFVYENNTDADLNLPKPTSTGTRTIGPRKRFQGDSYYLTWVGSPMNLLRFIEEIVPKDNPLKTLNESETNKMNDNKLILDQPETVTSQGQVEHVVVNESPDQDSSEKKTEILLNESPIEGLEIILG